MEFLHGFWSTFMVHLHSLKDCQFSHQPLFSVDLKWDGRKRHKTKYWLTIILKMLSHFHSCSRFCLTFHTFKMRKWEIWGRFAACGRKMKMRKWEQCQMDNFWRSYSLNVNSCWGWKIFTITMTLIVAWKSVRIRVKKRHHHAC